LRGVARRGEAVREAPTRGTVKRSESIYGVIAPVGVEAEPPLPDGTGIVGVPQRQPSAKILPTAAFLTPCVGSNDRERWCSMGARPK